MPSIAQSKSYEILETMQAWVLGDPQELSLTQKPVPQPGTAEVLVRVPSGSWGWLWVRPWEQNL